MLLLSLSCGVGVFDLDICPVGDICDYITRRVLDPKCGDPAAALWNLRKSKHSKWVSCADMPEIWTICQWFKSQYPTQNPKPFTNQWASISVCPGHLKPVWQRHVLTQPLKSSLAHYAYDRWHVQTHWAANTWPSTPQNKNIHIDIYPSICMCPTLNSESGKRKATGSVASPMMCKAI